MTLIWSFVVNGLVAGALYAFLAIGFSLIYNSSHIFHIAHGAVYTFAAYVFYFGYRVAALGIVLAAAIAVFAALAVGVGIEILVYRWIRRRGGSTSATLVASLGLVALMQSLYAMGFGTDTLIVNSGALPTIHIGPVPVTIQSLLLILVLFVSFAALQLFLHLSRWGGAIRALSDDPLLCAAHGLNADRLYSLVFAIGSAFAGVAAVIVSFDLGVWPEMGFVTIFVSVVALTVGGIGSLVGALVGGLLLGLVQQFATWKIDSSWQNGVVFLIMLGFLLVRPQGLLGARSAIRRA